MQPEIYQAWLSWGERHILEGLADYICQALDARILPPGSLWQAYRAACADNQPVVEYEGVHFPYNAGICQDTEEELLELLLGSAVKGSPVDPFPEDAGTDWDAVGILADWHEESGRTAMAAFLRAHAAAMAIA